jgi:hypothetical protein
VNDSITALVVEKGMAGYPLIFLHTLEDQRTLREIRLAADTLRRKTYFWTCGKGIMEDTRRQATDYVPNTANHIGALKHIKTLGEGCIIVLRLFHHHLMDPMAQAELLDLVPRMKMQQQMILITSPVLNIPMELEHEIDLIEAPLPSPAGLQVVLEGIFEATKVPANKKPSVERQAQLVDAAKGLTTQEAENAFSLSAMRPKIGGKTKADELWLPEIVVEQKCLALKKTPMLEYVRVVDGLSSIGGLDNLKDWIIPLGEAFSDEARKFGVSVPKGVLLVGPPGCGKSMFAKAVSASLQKPLLKLDMGRIFGSLVGQSEANLRHAIKTAEAMSPCILWIDEVEKGIAGATGANDSGVSARVLGGLLNWMQEKTSPVFIVATANDVTRMPPEMLRKGRFDEMFSIDLPTKRERKEILDIHIRRRGRAALIGGGDPTKIDLDHFSGPTSQDFTGAEIDGAIEQAMRVAFSKKKDLNAIDLQDAFDSTQPIAKTMQDRLQTLRDWCKARTRPANRAEVPEQRTGTAGRVVDGMN